MALRTPMQEKAAIWAERLLGQIAAGERIILPYIYERKAYQIAGRGVEEYARKHGYRFTPNRSFTAVTLTPPGQWAVAVKGAQKSGGAVAGGQR